VKRYSGQDVTAGSIIVRQLGTKFYPGVGTGLGKDYTIFAKVAGTVEFEQRGKKKYINVLPQ